MKKARKRFQAFFKRSIEGKPFQLPRFTQRILILKLFCGVSASTRLSVHDNRANDEADYDSHQHIIHIIL
jgi:hypothetical protein